MVLNKQLIGMLKHTNQRAKSVKLSCWNTSLNDLNVMKVEKINLTPGYINNLSSKSQRYYVADTLCPELVLRVLPIWKDKKGIEDDFEKILSYFPFLRERLSTPGGKLSGGEQQQLVIGRALMTAPKIILIDEPALGLGPIIVDRVYEILRALSDAGNTLLVVEQSTYRALENADRIYVLRNGQIELHGRSKDLGEDEIERAYFGFESSSPKLETHF